MKEDVVHILKCAVERGPQSSTPDLPQSPAEKDDTTWTMKLLFKWFPEAKTKHAIHDFHSKRKRHFVQRNGKTVRIPAGTLMKEDGLLDFHHAHIVEYLGAHAGSKVLVYGKETIEAFAATFEGLGKEYGIYEDITIGSEEVCVYPF